jgi:hypothetical protein
MADMNTTSTYLPDSYYEKRWSNWGVSNIEFRPTGSSGWLNLIKGSWRIVDSFCIYDDGRIAFDHWFPEAEYFRLCARIRSERVQCMDADVLKHCVRESGRGSVEKFIHRGYLVLIYKQPSANVAAYPFWWHIWDAAKIEAMPVNQQWLDFGYDFGSLETARAQAIIEINASFYR